jgi:uncharacterized membrane protein SpoIIM required for sporulation
VKEARFINKNIEDWRRIEESTEKGSLSDSETAVEDYFKSSNDLSYARTFYPHSRLSNFLNGLSTRIHSGIHTNEITPFKDISYFFAEYLPETCYEMRKVIGVAVLLFVIGTAIGWISSVLEPGYTRSFMGDGYVNMTIQNIEAGRPMDVYAVSKSAPMFTGITLNNILVGFRAFAAGILFGIGSALILLYNSVMVGTFLQFFDSYNLLDVAVQTIMVHGTIELSIIVLSAAAGMRLGSSILFPGTYTRGQSFIKGAKQAASLMISLVPFFIVAGFLEGYVTRRDGVDGYFIAIIALSFVLVWGYFVFYPLWKYGYRNRKQKIIQAGEE